MTKTKSTYLALLAVLLSPMAANAGVITIDFDGLEEAGNNLIGLAGGTYSEDGFTISAGNLFYAQQGNGDYAGSAGVHARITNGVINMVFTAGGSLFGVSSIDLSILNPNGVSPDVTFTGDLFGGGTVMQTFSVNAFGFVTNAFSSAFSGLTALRWQQGTGEFNAHQFDNIVARVPEPGTLALLGIGLAGMGLARRKKV